MELLRFRIVEIFAEYFRCCTRLVRSCCVHVPLFVTDLQLISQLEEVRLLSTNLSPGFVKRLQFQKKFTHWCFEKCFHTRTFDFQVRVCAALGAEATNETTICCFFARCGPAGVASCHCFCHCSVQDEHKPVAVLDLWRCQLWKVSRNWSDSFARFCRWIGTCSNLVSVVHN